MKNQKLYGLIVAVSTLLIYSCAKTTNSAPPVLTTTTITSITGITANGGGNISSDGGDAITARGVCWSTSANPTTADSKTTNGSGTGSFVSALAGLIPSTIYHVRAYAMNSSNTGYGNDVSFETSFVCGVSTIKDADGNVYNTVSIGGQCWTKENLKTSKYKDNTTIPTGLNDAAWQATTTGAYSIYNDNATNNSTYGKLYNWYAVNTGKLAPAGWHVPADSEWTTLTTYLGGASLAGDKMKSTSSLWTPYTGIINTNSSSFTGLPGGFRNYAGTYYYSGTSCFCWSSTEYTINKAWYNELDYNESSAYETATGSKANGMSIRCIKD